MSQSSTVQVKWVYTWQESRTHLRVQEALGFLMLKYAFSHILETFFLWFLTPRLTPKNDKNRTLHCISINLRYLYVITYFAIQSLWNKLCFRLFTLSRYTKWKEARKFYEIRAEEQINCVIGSILFQSKMSVDVFKLEIYILKWVNNHHYISFHIARNESSNCEKLRPRCTPNTPEICETKTNFQFGWVEKWYAEWTKAGKFLKLELWQLAKYYTNNMQTKWRKLYLFSAKWAKRESLTGSEGSLAPCPLPGSATGICGKRSSMRWEIWLPADEALLAANIVNP